MTLKKRLQYSIILIAVGIAVNAALAGVKMYVGLSANSLCIMLDATNSLFDILTGIVTLIAFCVLFIPRSEKTPFGYGRSEYLAGFIVAVASAVVGGLFFMQSLNRMAMPEPVWFGWQNCVLISCAIPVKLALGLTYYFCNKKLKSKAIAAIALDCFLDVGITSASLVSFAVSSNVDYAVDAIFGIVMSVVVIAFAIVMIVDNVKCVVRGDGAEEEKKIIEGVLSEYDDIAEVKKITAHDYGYASKVCTVEVVLKEGVTMEEFIALQADVGEKIKSKCGAEVLLSLTGASKNCNDK